MKKIAFALVLSVLILSLVAVPMTAAKGGKSGCTTIKDGTLEDVNGNPLVLGYDQFGYNYQAHLFNGRYCDYDRVIGGPYCDVTLVMKWSDTWMSNRDCNNDGKLDRGYSCDPDNATSSACPGAWVTNHQRGSYLGNWDVTGDWVLEFDYLGSLYIHDMTVIDNTFTGTGGYPSGSDPYPITWTVIGTIDGDNIEMTIDYDSSSYYVDVVGTIAQDGTMGGTWSNPTQSGVWESTLGVATGEVYKWNYFVKIVAVPADATLAGGIWYTADGTEIGPAIWGAYARVLQVYNDQGTGEHGIEYLSPAGPGLGKWK